MKGRKGLSRPFPTVLCTRLVQAQLDILQFFPGNSKFRELFAFNRLFFFIRRCSNNWCQDAEKELRYTQSNQRKIVNRLSLTFRGHETIATIRAYFRYA